MASRYGGLRRSSIPAAPGIRALSRARVPETRAPTDRDSLARWAAAIAAPGAAPAGGAAGAVGAALAAATVEMVAGMTASRERYVAVHGRAAAVRGRAAALREELLGLAERDTAAFAAFDRALALPRRDDPERAARDEAKRAALREGARVQFTLLERAAEIAELAAELAADGLATAIGDAAAAGFLAAGVARSAYWAVRSNLQESGPLPEGRHWLAAGLVLLERAETAEWRIRHLLNQRVR